MRLDIFLCQNGYFDSRTKADRCIRGGGVKVCGIVIDKPAYNVIEGAKIEITEREKFVSLGGYKLEKALIDFHFSVVGMTAIDLGASTGGFTDCLLQNGAKRVFAVDLNDNLLSPQLKQDNRVSPIIKNVKELAKSDFDCDIDLVVADLSFISLTKAMSIVYSISRENNFAILLIKPQFENEEKRNFKNGIVKDKKTRLNACKKIYNCAIENGFSPQGITTAPIRENKNEEYLILLKKAKGCQIPFDKIFVASERGENEEQGR